MESELEIMERPSRYKEIMAKYRIENLTGGSTFASNKLSNRRFKPKTIEESKKKM